MLKTCTHCKQAKPLSSFSSNSKKTPSPKANVYSWCKPCKKIKDRANSYRRKYGLTEDQLDQMMLDQNERCSICDGKLVWKHETNYPCVDHCHKTDEVRGLLCNRCNLGIGYLKDDPAILEAAARYLKRSSDATCSKN